MPPRVKTLYQAYSKAFKKIGLFSIAPMIDKTSRHFRHFLRLLTKRAVLYTEMVTAPAIIHGKRGMLLDFAESEHPLILQVGGDDPAELAEAVRIAEGWGYDEYNLNVGCPSDKVQKGSFGACLMADPQRVAEIVAAMAAVTRKPISVKHRVGIEGFGYRRESFEELVEFVKIVAAAGCERFIGHARMAMLEGLSPKENRSVPPIRYADVHRLKQLYPNIRIELNGQVRSFTDAAEHLAQGVDGIMIGRASYENPLLMAGLDAFEAAWNQGGAVNPTAAIQAGQQAVADLDRPQIVREYAEYVDVFARQGLNPRSLIWPILELFPGIRGSRRFKQILSQPYTSGAAVVDLVAQALQEISSVSLDA